MKGDRCHELSKQFCLVTYTPLIIVVKVVIYLRLDITTGGYRNVVSSSSPLRLAFLRKRKKERLRC